MARKIKLSPRQLEEEEKEKRRRSADRWRRRQNKEYDGLSFSHVTPDAVMDAVKKMWDGSQLIGEAVRTMEYANKGLQEATFDSYQCRVLIRTLCRDFTRYGAHTHDCEWNNVTVGDLEQEENQCTCGWVNFRMKANQIVHRKLGERRW